MTEYSLNASYDQCRESGSSIMNDIFSTLEDAGLVPRVNTKQTEIVVDVKEKEVFRTLEKKGLCTEIFRFLIFTKEQKKKTYIRLLYN